MITGSLTKVSMHILRFLSLIVFLSFAQTPLCADDSKNPDFIFVGAGPVGLWTGIQLKIRQPDADILFLEKHSVYKRTHTLRVDKSSYRGSVRDPRIKKLISEFHGHIRNSRFEENLLKVAKDLGIRIKYKKVSGLEELTEEYPATRFIVGSDGSHSKIRKSVTGGQSFFQKDLKYMVDIKYEVKGQGKASSYWDAYATTKIMNHFATEYVGRCRNGVTPVTMRLFVSQKDFEGLKGSSFGNPYILGPDRDKIPASVDESIKIWMNMKALRYGEQRVEGSEKVLPVLLQAYNSSSFLKSTPDGRHTILVGDAAFGVPFYRSLNNGLMEGSRLALALSDGLTSGDMEASLRGYTDFMVSMVSREIAYARVKSSLLSCLDWLVRISSFVPWQVNFWSSKNIKLFKTRDPSYQNPLPVNCLLPVVTDPETTITPAG